MSEQVEWVCGNCDADNSVCDCKYDYNISIGKWISLEDEKPQTKNSVLIYCPEIKCCFTACYYGDDDWEYFAKGSVEVLEKVSHWAHLPSLPRGEK